jgi:hypothetical protein
MIIQQNDPQTSRRTLIHVSSAAERRTANWLRTRALLPHDVRAGDTDVYDDLVSSYSLGAMTGHGAPPARETSIAGRVS